MNQFKKQKNEIEVITMKNKSATSRMINRHSLLALLMCAALSVALAGCPGMQTYDSDSGSSHQHH